MLRERGRRWVFAMHLERSCHRCKRRSRLEKTSQYPYSPRGEIGAVMMMNPSQVIIRALPVSEFPAASRNGQSIDADFAHVGSSSRLHTLHCLD